MDEFNLERFVEAQQDMYSIALSQLKNGKKTDHWIWFIFPQLKQLGKSPRSRLYGISGLEEAKAYIAHPVLGPRLLESVNALLQHKGKPIGQIMDTVDAKKLRSSMTLFQKAAPEIGLFEEVLRQFFRGMPDYLTLSYIEE